MLDVRAIREDPDRFRRGLARRNLADAVDMILELDERRRALTIRVEELRAEQNRTSKAIGGAQGEEKQRLIAEVAEVSAELKELEPQLDQVEAGLADVLARTPNLPHESAPDGFTDEDAVEVRRHGEGQPDDRRRTRAHGCRQVIVGPTSMANHPQLLAEATESARGEPRRSP